ncbi:TPA: hypothetical protein RQK90_004695 [Vibrio vulnificus]|nr:hypothetical protein [Vibrio vulnificus]
MRRLLLVLSLSSLLGGAHATPVVERIIENAPNPIGGANAFDFHHYALNRKVFDNTGVDIPGNNFGLSLESSHPHFSESLAGNVISYYEKGEKPRGTTTSVWNFLMNASGSPLSYTPSVDPNKFCVYFHRRYLLSQIAADAASAVTNLGFVNTPDQWWIQVQEIFDKDGKLGGAVGPDYVIWDHPDAAGGSKFAQLAREQKAIQTQSNEKWCFAYDVPVAIKLIKGKKVINETNVQWPNQWKPWLDPVIKIPTINGYAHFLGANQYPLQPNANTSNVQYLGYEYLAHLIDDDDYVSSEVTKDQAAYIKKNTHAAVTQFWKNFVKFGLDTNSDDPFSVELRDIFSKTDLPMSARTTLAKKSISNKTISYLTTEAKNYPINKFKGNLYASFGNIDKIKKIFKSIKANGFRNTLSNIKLTSLKNLAKSAGPEGVLSLGFNIWNIADNIKNPGNPVESMIIYYVPGLMDGMTLSVDTSTLTNNFHLTSQFSELNEKNTSELPVAAFNAHVQKIIEPFGNQSCFFTDEENPESLWHCIEEDRVQNIRPGYERFQLPLNYWLKVSLNGKTAYLTSSYVRSGATSQLQAAMDDENTLIQLIKKDNVLKANTVCAFNEEAFQGQAYCSNGSITLAKHNVFGESLKSLLLNDTEKEDVMLEFNDGNQVPMIASIPYLDVFDSQLVRVINGDESDNEVWLYNDEYYRGKSIAIDRSVSDLNILNFNDVLQSYRIPQGWTVRFYEHGNYKGRYYTRISSDYHATPFIDSISSVRVFRKDQPILWDHAITYTNLGAYIARIRFVDEKTGNVIHSSPGLGINGRHTYRIDYDADIKVELQKNIAGWYTFKTFSAEQVNAMKKDIKIDSWGAVFNPASNIK